MEHLADRKRALERRIRAREFVFGIQEGLLSMRASSAYSSGAHDNWNVFVTINRKRRLGEQVAMFFDGRPASPAEMETEISPGYEFR